MWTYYLDLKWIDIMYMNPLTSVDLNMLLFLDPNQLFKVGDAVKIGENSWEAPIQINNPIDREVLQARYQFMIEVWVQYLFLAWNTQLLFDDNLFGRQHFCLMTIFCGRHNFCLITIYLEDKIFVLSQFIWKTKILFITIYLEDKNFVCSHFIWKIKLLFVHNLFGRQNCCLFTIYLEDKIVVCSQFIWKTKLLSVHNFFKDKIVFHKF